MFPIPWDWIWESGSLRNSPGVFLTGRVRTSSPISRGCQQEETAMTHIRSIRVTCCVSWLVCMVLLAGPTLAADVTPDRLINADKEPHNWLTNHRTYDGQRFSPLARIDKDNVKGLKLVYAVPLGGGAGNEYSVATPLAEDGFLYVTDSWGVLYNRRQVGRHGPNCVAHGSETRASAA